MCSLKQSLAQAKALSIDSAKLSNIMSLSFLDAQLALWHLGVIFILDQVVQYNICICATMEYILFSCNSDGDG
jgi:hypothetical protein